MEKDKPEYKKINFILFIIIIFLFLLSLVFILRSNTASEDFEDNKLGAENIKYETSIAKKTNKAPLNGEKINLVSYFFDESDKERTAFSGLLNYGVKNNIEIEYNNNYDFGVFIESIGGVANGDEGKYWQYYVNGTLGEVAADKKVLKEGDGVEWRFEKVDF